MKKGFTLVEIMAVILILGVILVIAIPTFNKVVEESKNKLYKNLNETVVKTTKTYATENAFLMPTEEGESVEVTVNELISTGYLKELKNPGDKEDTCNGYVIITRLADEQYAYNPHINCFTDIASSTEDGLVLHYTFDDFQEPTINLATGTLSPYTPYNTLTRNGQDLTFTMVSGGAQYLTFHNGVDYNGKIIAISGKMFKNGVPHIVSGNRSNTYHSVPAIKWDYDLTNGNFEIVENCNTSSIWLFHTPAGTTGSDVIKINDFQVELKPYATPFVNGSRTGIVKDYSGNNNISNLSLDTTPRWMPNTDGISGYYDLMSGKWMAVANSQSLNLNSFTINVWVKYRDYTYPKTFGAIKKSSPSCYLSTGKGFDFGHGYQSLGLDICLGDGVHVVRNTLQFNLGNRPPDLLNKWTHLSLVVDRSNGYIYSYINGELQSHKVNISSVTGDINTTASLTIGTLYGWTTDASLDDFRIYNRVLNAEEIKFIYEMTK